MTLVVKYMRKIKRISDIRYKPSSEIKTSATQCSNGELCSMLRHGESQPRIKEGASHHALRYKNAEAFLIHVILEIKDKYFKKSVVFHINLSLFLHIL